MKQLLPLADQVDMATRAVSYPLMRLPHRCPVGTG